MTWEAHLGFLFLLAFTDQCHVTATVSGCRLPCPSVFRQIILSATKIFSKHCFHGTRSKACISSLNLQTIWNFHFLRGPYWFTEKSNVAKGNQEGPSVLGGGGREEAESNPLSKPLQEWPGQWPKTPRLGTWAKKKPLVPLVDKRLMKAWRTSEKWQSESQRLLNRSTDVTKVPSKATAIPVTIVKNEFKIQNFRNWGCAVSVPFWILYWAPQNLLCCCHGTIVLIVNGVKWSPKVCLSLLVKWAIRAHKNSPVVFKTATSFLVSWDQIWIWATTLLALRYWASVQCGRVASLTEWGQHRCVIHAVIHSWYTWKVPPKNGCLIRLTVCEPWIRTEEGHL